MRFTSLRKLPACPVEQPWRGQPLRARATRTSRGAGYAVFLTPTEAIISLRDARAGRAVVRVTPVAPMSAPRSSRMTHCPGWWTMWGARRARRPSATARACRRRRAAAWTSDRPSRRLPR